jgi:predicted PurR-regulated permease PerM/CBS domain-containing protein
MTEGGPEPSRGHREGGSNVPPDAAATDAHELDVVPERRIDDIEATLAVEPGAMAGGPPRVVVPRWIQLVALPLLVLGVWAIARAAGPVLLIFTVAAVLALILDPVVRVIQRAGVPRGLAVATVYVGFWAAIATGAILLVNPIGDQIEAFSANVPDYVRSAGAGLEDLQGWLDRRGIDLEVQAQGQDALSELQRDVLAKFEDAVGFTRDLVELVIAAIFALILIIVISVYMLLYARPIGDLARRVMPPGDGTPEDDFPSRVVRSVAGYVKGQLLFSAIMGTSAGLALWIFGALGIFEEGRTYALFFGVFYGFMELIPYVGPVLGATPPVLIALVQDPLTAIWLVLLFIALQQLEGHVVAPLVFGRALRINPLLVIFALLFGAHLYGIVGALVALPLAAMLRETIVYLRDHLALERWPVAAAGGPTGLLGGDTPEPAAGGSLGEHRSTSVRVERSRSSDSRGAGGKMPQIRDRMTSDVVTIEPSASVVDAAKRMIQAEKGPLPVVESGRVVGMVTDRDIIARVVAEGREPGSVTVDDVSTKELVTASPDEDLDEARRLMADHELDRILVTEGDRLVGIISEADIRSDEGPLA